MSVKLKRFWNQYQYDRQLTMDMLKSLSNEDLAQSPGPGVGPFWKQFRHMGRVQEKYMEALDTGSVKFDDKASYSGGADGAKLLQYLERLDQELEHKLQTLDDAKQIDWFGAEKLTAFDHLLRMMGHETLHHGQWIIYCKLMGKPFPDSWKIWGL